MRSASSRGSRRHLDELRRLRRQADAAVAVISVCPGPPAARRAHPSAFVELGRRRRAGEAAAPGPARPGARLRRGSASTARRCSRYEPNRRRSGRRRDLDVVQVRSQPGPRSRSSSRRPRGFGRRRVGVVAQLTAWEAELEGALGKQRGEKRDRFPPSLHESRAEIGDPSGPRRDGVSRRGPDRDPPQSGVPLRHGRAVLGRHAGPGGKQAPQSTVEVRPPSGWAALDDDEAIGREHERRDLGASCSAARRVAPFNEPSSHRPGGA